MVPSEASQGFGHSSTTHSVNLYLLPCELAMCLKEQGQAHSKKQVVPLAQHAAIPGSTQPGMAVNTASPGPSEGAGAGYVPTGRVTGWSSLQDSISSSTTEVQWPLGPFLFCHRLPWSHQLSRG